MNQRTITVLVVIVIVLGAIWAITAYQTSARTQQHLTAIQTGDTEAAVRALEDLGTRGPEIVAELRGMLNNDHALVRSRAVRLIGAVGKASHAQLLVPVLQMDDAAYVRRDAATAMGRLGAEDALLPLTEALKNEREADIVRAAAARSLGLVGEKGAVPALSRIIETRPAIPDPADEEELEDPTEDLRVAAAQALGNFPVDIAVEALAQAVDHSLEPSLKVRTAAAYSLGDLATDAEQKLQKPAVEALLHAYKDPIGDVRIAAIHAFTKMRLIPEDLGRTIKQTVTKAQRDNHFWVRAAARDALNHLAKMGI
ncbi:MAG: HEAT repeat domain-containing protein [Armatimonadota bacterium]